MSSSVEVKGTNKAGQLFTALLRKMPEVNASDLIVTPNSPPQFKINGSLQPFGDAVLAPEDTLEFARFLLSEAQFREFTEKRSIDMSTGMTGTARFRANIFYQRGSVAMAIRMIPHEIPSFKELGLPDIVSQFASRPHGLVLITGPAGSGKSTTMAAMIDSINKQRPQHIVCIEDPIEYVHRHNKCIVHQREILDDAHTFSDALRSVFRQAPDVIMVGEMRDLETIRLALQLAETGHLILATFHTHDTTSAVNRMVSVFPPHEQQQVATVLSMVLVGIISQCLLVTKNKLRRVLACEVLVATHAIRNLIREHQSQQIYSAIQTGKGDGMTTMNESLFDLCSKGLVEQELAMQRSPLPKELARMLKI